MSFNNTTYTSTKSVTAPVIEKILLPTQVIEKPVAVHEEIRKELIEEIQPVINVEKVKTEIHQVTQPLFDKEVRPVVIENRTLNTEILPEVFVEGRGVAQASEISTTRFLPSSTRLVEKPALINEIEKTQIIEEIQPVIYKETVVPMVIQETKPVFQKIVEGNVYTQETLASRSVATPSIIAPAYIPSTEIIAPVRERVLLPTQIVEKPTAVHEEIRRETIEEIQPVVNVEKIKTEVRQITQPLFDKEVKPVLIEKRTLAQEILPEVLVEGRGVRAVEDFSTTRYLDTTKTIVEKPTIYNEVERTQIIEEIQPVVYKETVVPLVIKETKPVFQKIVEGTVYTHQTLPARSLNGSGYTYPATGFVEVPVTAPILAKETIIAEVITPQETILVEKLEPIAIVETPLRKEIMEETITTTTTVAAAPVQPAKHGLFHRHSKDNLVNTSSRTSSWSNTTTSRTGAPVEHLHSEKLGVNGQKIIEDTTITRNHTEAVLPARVI